MLAIIDLDSCVYKAAGAAQKTNKETKEVEYADTDGVIARANAKKLITSIMEMSGCNKYEAYLTTTNDETCYRKLLYPEYKANRRDSQRPRDYHIVREYYIQHWDASVVSSIEADDAVCMRQYASYIDGFTYEDGKTIPAALFGIDKDLDQVPGLHCNYSKQEWYYISPLEGLKNFYKQVLGGDRADNIPRIQKGWKCKEAFTDIDKAQSEEEVVARVYKEFESLLKFNKEQIVKELKWRGDLLYLKRSMEDSFEVPIL